MYYNIEQPKTSVGQWMAGYTVAFCAFTGGTSSVWAATFFSKVNEHEIRLTLSDLETASIASFIHIGQVLATIPTSYMQNALGRRCVLLLTIPLQLIAWLIIFFLHHIWAILLARLLMGLWIGFYTTVCPAYMSETSVSSIRGRMIAQMKIMSLCGFFFQSIVGIYMSYDAGAIVSFILTFFHYIAILYIPESIYSLLRLNRHEEAERALIWLRGKDDVSVELGYIQRYLDEQMSRKSDWGEIFRWPASRRAFGQAISLILVQNLSGFPALSSYISIIVPDSWISSDHYLMLWSVICLIFLIISVCCVDHIDRKVLLIISSSGCSLFAMLIAIWFYLHENTSVDMSKTLWLPTIFLSIHAAFYSIGLLYVPMVFQGEVFPMNIKSKATSILVFSGFSVSIISVQLFIPLQEHLGNYFNFLLYSLVALAGCFISMRIVETRKRTLEHIQKQLEGTTESRISV